MSLRIRRPAHVRRDMALGIFMIVGSALALTSWIAMAAIYGGR